MKILLVEDTPELGLWLKNALQKMGLEVALATDGNEAAQQLLQHQFALIILDLNLPKRDGLSVLLELRERKDFVPVLILTAKAEVGDRVKGLNAGADDYLPKPFDLLEFEARVHALLRRAGHGENDALTHLGALSYDKQSSSFGYQGQPLNLTPREAFLLRLMFERKNRVVTKEFLHEQIFGHEETMIDAIEVLVYRLRKKIVDAMGVEVITVRGVGYMLKQINQP